MQKKSLIVITSASKGIRKALAIKFSEENHPCLLISRHSILCDELVGKKTIHFSNLDVKDYSAFKAAVREIEKLYGKTECLINNAGHIKIGSFSELSIEACHFELDVLVKGVVNSITRYVFS